MAMSRLAGGRWLTIRSPMAIVPPETVSSPATILSRVDLPQSELQSTQGGVLLIRFRTGSIVGAPASDSWSHIHTEILGGTGNENGSLRTTCPRQRHKARYIEGCSQHGRTLGSIRRRSRRL